MQVFRNKFRVRNLKTRQIERLNVVEDINGNYRFVVGFDSLAQAQAAIDVYKLVVRSEFEVETYSTQQRHEIEQPSIGASKLLEAYKVFSGKGLKFNTDTRLSSENKYDPNGWYGREVYMYQSTERNKGLSLVYKQKGKANPIENSGTFAKIKALTNDGCMTLDYCVVESLRKQVNDFANRKEMYQWLRSRHYTNRKSKRIIEQVFQKY